MAERRNPNRPLRGKPTEPWRIERMVQRVPGHINEESRFSPWLVVGAVGIVILVGAMLLFFNRFPTPSIAGGGQPNDPARTSTRRPTTFIVLTATPQNTEAPTLAPTPVVIKYTVKKGDTLSGIAQKYNVTVQAIRNANNLTGDTIKVGDVLNIPVPVMTPTPQALAVATGSGGPVTSTPVVLNTPTLIAFATSDPALQGTPAPTQGVSVYTVKQGDTLARLAAMYNTTVAQLMSLNQLTSQNLRVGQQLKVPLPPQTATPAPTATNTPLPLPPTLTPEFAYPAPALLSPKDGADIAHDTPITLMWTSAGTLQSDEYYVVHLRYAKNGTEQSLSIPVSEGTSYKLETSGAEAAAVTGPAEISWYVVVVRGSGCGSVAPAAVQPCAVSPVSETRTFTWR